MQRNVTPENIYQEYHRQSMFKRTGVYPRPIKNFDKIKQKSTWTYFERFAESINRGAGQIDYKLYIQALAEFYTEGYIPPRSLGHPKGFKIYKNFINTKEECDTLEEIEKLVLSSTVFVIKYCLERDLRYNDYMFENQYLLPTLLKHYNSGNLSKYFLATIPGVVTIINGFAPDAAFDYANKFLKDYNNIRSKVVMSPKLRKLSDNLEVTINRQISINKNKNRKEQE